MRRPYLSLEFCAEVRQTDVDLLIGALQARHSDFEGSYRDAHDFSERRSDADLDDQPAEYEREQQSQEDGHLCGTSLISPCKFPSESRKKAIHRSYVPIFAIMRGSWKRKRIPNRSR